MSENAPDVEELQARLAALEAENAALAAKKRWKFDGRSFGAWTVLIIAALLLPVALTAFWAQRTLTDTQRYIDTVAPLSQDPTIQNAVGDKVSEALITQVDAQARVSELLADYPKLQVLSGPISSGVNSLIERSVAEILASDQFDQVWVAINEKAQQALVSVLEGKKTGAVTVEDGQVVLDTGDLFLIVQQRLVDRGLSFVANATLPPVADRQIVLLESEELARAQALYQVAQPVAQWLIYVVLLMFVGAVLLSRNRPKMTIAVGISMMLGAFVMKLLLVVGQNQISLSLQDTPFAEAEKAFFTILTTFLVDAGRAAFVLGLILVVVGWFLSQSRAAVRTRTAISGVLTGAGDKAGHGALGTVGAFVARTHGVWRTLVVAAGVGAVLLADQVTGSLLLWTTVLVVLGLVVVEFLSAAGRASATAEEGESVAEPVEEPADVAG